MQAAQIIGGYSLGGADLLRRAMGKKKPEEMVKHREIFAEGAAKQGIRAKNPTKSSTTWKNSPATVSTNPTLPPTP